MNGAGKGIVGRYRVGTSSRRITEKTALKSSAEELKKNFDLN